MIYKKIFLKDIDERFKNKSSFLRIYISERNERVPLRPGLLICPGGGYQFCSEREAEPVAFRFLSEGFNCFILNYSVNEKYPIPHLDLALVVSYIRKHEKEFDLLPDSLSIMGFSAGGHLVGSYAYLYNELAKDLSLEESILKPNNIILAYPVVSMDDEITHLQTRQIITCGDNFLAEKLNIYKHIDKNYPSTFIWTTKEDTSVPYQNSLMLIESLKTNNVKNEFVLYQNGFHGGSLVNYSCFKKGDIPEKMVGAREWVQSVVDFIFDVLK